MEAIHSSETSFDFHQTSQCYIPRDGTLHRTVNIKLVANILITCEMSMLAAQEWFPAGSIC
jgi:hypothetical protein